jgi:hypothetical protein
MTIDQALAEVLDQTVKALSNLNSAKLLVLKKRIAVLAKSDVKRDKERFDVALLKNASLKSFFRTFMQTLTRLRASTPAT